MFIRGDHVLNNVLTNSGLGSAVRSCTNLSLHVHDDHCVGAIAHYKVLRVLGQQDDVVDGDVCAGRRAQRFEGVAALGGLHVPHLRQKHCSLWRETHTSDDEHDAYRDVDMVNIFTV